MKKILTIIIFIFVTAVFTVTADVLGETVATVNLIKPEMITSQEVQNEINAYNQQLKKSGLPQRKISKKQMLDNLISSILILQGAERDGVKVTKEQIQKVINTQMKSVEKQLGRTLTVNQFKEIVQKQTGTTWETYLKNLKDQMIKQMYISRKKSALFKAVKEPTEAEIENKYQDNVTKLVSPEYIRVSMIYMSTLNKTASEKTAIKKKMTAIYQKLKNGVITFDDAASKYSSDNALKYRGGDIGYIRRDDRNTRARLGNTFFNDLFNLKVNEISGVLESNTGYQIVRITEKRAPRVLGLNDPIAPGKSITVHDYLKTGIFQERQQAALQKALKEVVAELKKEADINIF